MVTAVRSAKSGSTVNPADKGSYPQISGCSDDNSQKAVLVEKICLWGGYYVDAIELTWTNGMPARQTSEVENLWIDGLLSHCCPSLPGPQDTPTDGFLPIRGTMPMMTQAYALR